MLSTLDFQKDLLPHSDRLFRLAMRFTLNREEAEDIVEETLLKVWQKHEDLSEINNLEHYLLTICKRLSLDHIARKEHSNISLEQVEVETTDVAASPLEQVATSDRVQWIRHLINALPQKQRAIIQLRDIEEKSVKETSEILGISPEDVKTSHHRARRSLREKLEQLDNHGL